MKPEATAPAAVGSGQARDGGDKPFLPRWVMWLAIPAAVGPILILGFVLVTERAHDPQSCPFAEVSRRQLGPSIAVIETARSCVPDIEEHDWTIERDGRHRVLGNRRLDHAAFADGYQWTAELSAEDEVRVTVTNPGHGYVLFREGTPEERARDGR